MKCNKAYELIHEYLDGTLDDERRSAFEAHASSCEACAREIGALREVESLLGLMGTSAPAEVPAGFSDGVISRLRAAGRIRPQPVRAPRRRRAAIPWRIRIPAAVALVMVVAAIVFPSTVGTLTGLAGKGVVVLADAYTTVQAQVAKAEALRGVFDGVVALARLFMAVLVAAFSILATLGSVFKLPAFASIVVLCFAAVIYVRATHRRGARHASLAI